MGAQLKIAVVVLNFNGFDRSVECLDGLRHQTHPQTEVLVVDNGSTDGSGPRLRAYAPWAGHLLLSRNFGYAGGNNRGIRMLLERPEGSVPDLIMILNNDVVLEPDCLERLVPLAQGRDTVIGPISYQAGTVDQVDLAAISLDSVDGLVSTPWRGEQRSPGTLPELIPTDYVTGSALLAPVELWRRQLFEERYFLTWEDTEFGVRARRRGYGALIATGAIARHHGSATFGGTFNPLYRYYYTRNHLLFLRRNFSLGRRLRAYRRTWRRLRGERAWHLRHNGEEGLRHVRAIDRALTDFVLRRWGPLRGSL